MPYIESEEDARELEEQSKKVAELQRLWQDRQTMLAQKIGPENMHTQGWWNELVAQFSSPNPTFENRQIVKQCLRNLYGAMLSAYPFPEHRQEM